LSAAIDMGMKTNHTTYLTYPGTFNKTLEDTEPYIAEAQNAVQEAKTLHDIYQGYQKGSDPW
jgi:hypothetical protein